MKKYIIILGSRRTGTTALSKIIAESNENIAYLPELKFFFMGLSNRKNMKNIVDIYTRALLKFLKFNKEFEQKIDFEKSVQKFAEVISTKEFTNELTKYKIALEFLVDEILDGKVYEYYILQTPANLFMLDLIDEVLPDKYIIYTLRDARSFISSAYCGSKKWADSIVKLVVYWNYCAKVLKKMMKKYQGILIKQEELLLDEKGQIDKIAQFLSIPLKYKEQSQMINSSFTHKNKEEALYTYKKLLTENDIQMIEFFSKEYLVYFGYEKNIKSFRPNIKIFFDYYFNYLKTIINHTLIVRGYSDLLYKIKN